MTHRTATFPSYVGLDRKQRAASPSAGVASSSAAAGAAAAPLWLSLTLASRSRLLFVSLRSARHHFLLSLSSVLPALSICFHLRVSARPIPSHLFESKAGTRKKHHGHTTSGRSREPISNPREPHPKAKRGRTGPERARTEKIARDARSMSRLEEDIRKAGKRKERRTWSLELKQRKRCGSFRSS